MKMVIGDMGLFAAQRAILSAAGTAAVTQRLIDTHASILSRLTPIAGGQPPASIAPSSTNLPRTSATGPDPSASSTGGLPKPVLIAAAAGVGLLALLVVAKKKKR